MNKENQNKEKDPYNLPGKWYAISCYSGYEEKVRSDLLQRIETLNMQDYIFDVRIIKQQDPAVKKSASTTKVKNVYQGYLFVNMHMTDGAWYVVRNTPRVRGLLGSSGGFIKPIPLSQDEVRNMLKLSLQQGVTTPKKIQETFEADFEVGDIVKVLSGAFENKEGEVLAMDYTKGVATINIELFGRVVHVEAEFSYCEKITY